MEDDKGLTNTHYSKAQKMTLRAAIASLLLPTLPAIKPTPTPETMAIAAEADGKFLARVRKTYGYRQDNSENGKCGQLFEGLKNAREQKRKARQRLWKKCMRRSAGRHVDTAQASRWQN